VAFGKPGSHPGGQHWKTADEDGSTRSRAQHAGDRVELVGRHLLRRRRATHQATLWFLRENGLVPSQIETLSSVALDQIGIVVANDSARSSFTAVSGEALLALDQDLNILGRWPLGSATGGWHASSPGRGLALISGPSEVRLLHETGRTFWAYPHTAWAGNFESGCTWFDSAGQPHAVIPAPSYDGCLVVRFDLETGAPLAQAPIVEAEPAGINPVHHPDGWVGLSEGEGQDAARAWWVRSASPAAIEVIDAGWDDWVFSDVHHSGRTILTTPHSGGPLTVRSFPSLEVLLSVDSPSTEDHSGWDFTACFVGDDVIINKLIGDDERLAAIDLNGEVHDLDELEEGWLVPAADGTWLAVSGTAIRRCKLTQQEGPSAGRYPV
jgi:hypothetical protein